MERPGRGFLGSEKIPIGLAGTDVVMPMMTGAELAERVVVMRRGIKVLYMSGHAREALDGEQVRGQGVEFLQKPFTRQSLLDKVHSVLVPDE
jgi:FixJ family two-component response regulator